MTLSFKDRDFYATGINHYVPGMTGKGSLAGVIPLSLGSPAVNDNDIIDTDIDADAVAGVEVAQSYTSDSPYGRTLTVNYNADPQNSAAVDVYGTDYLGQPMVERFTGANGSTAIIYGKKAFYTVTKTAIVTASTAATTIDLGLGYRLGLPYKMLDVAWVKENGVLVPVHKHAVFLQGSLSAADVVSGSSLWFYAPFPGYIKTLYAIGGNGSTTDAAATVEIETTAVTGLSATADQGAQLLISDTPTTAGYNANNRFVKGARIEIVQAATTSGGGTSYMLEVIPTQVTAADKTDPATVNTGDPRGTYEPLATLDGATEIELGFISDSEVNATGNGGLHGIQHYYG